MAFAFSGALRKRCEMEPFYLSSTATEQQIAACKEWIPVVSSTANFIGAPSATIFRRLRVLNLMRI